jgi:outer membrane protein OmpA-like peptidoglycan-associated protein
MPALAVSLAVATIDSLSQEKPVKQIVVEDYIRTQYRPLLNYLFFDQGSSQLPSRYHLLGPNEVQRFNYATFNDYETLPLYYEALNIFGQRMRDFPKARMTIVGCNDGQAENSNKDLSKGRAEHVFDYLRDMWHVEPERMKLEFRNLPEKPSSVSDTDGSAENRRVEISSNTWQIMEPILTTDTAHVPKPSIVRFLLHAAAEAGVKNYIVSVKVADRGLKDFTGNDTLPPHLDLDLDKEPGAVLKKLGILHTSLTVADQAGQSAGSDEISIPVRHYTLLDKHLEGSVDTIISRYNLILFDFNRNELTEANQRITSFVHSRITEESKVQILGYTDRMGSDQYNQKLSENRAKSTQQSIGVKADDVRGLGRSQLLYDNTLPEGRFYCRTVTVVVTTPTKE